VRRWPADRVLHRLSALRAGSQARLVIYVADQMPQARLNLAEHDVPAPVLGHRTRTCHRLASRVLRHMIQPSMT